VTYCGEQLESGIRLFFVDISALHVPRHIHPVELLLTSDKTVAEAATYTTHKQY